MSDFETKTRDPSAQLEVCSSAAQLLARDGAHFIASAYATLLRRQADSAGFGYYLDRLKRTGDKIAILIEIASSPEGRRVRFRVPGMLRYSIRQRLSGIPIIGSLLRLASISQRADHVLATLYNLEGRVSRFEDKLLDFSSNLAGTFTPRADGEAEAVGSARLISQSHAEFDPHWYLTTYTDVASSGCDALEHYLNSGKREGRFGSYVAMMNELFDADSYLAANPDVAAAGIDPLLHFLSQGKKEGRQGGSLQLAIFDPEWYARNNPDVIRQDDDPLRHFLKEGFAQRRSYTSFVPIEKVEAEQLIYSEAPVSPKVKVVAFYLPQYHPIRENDEWWGRGFTEWTNVIRGRQFYEDHEQPKLPGELGFYDLRVPDVMRRQAELARLHGVHGFCLYVYWFAGKRLLEGPLQTLLNHPEIDIAFCYCWANENWTRRWDGLDHDVLIGQKHSPSDDIAFIAEVSRAFNDNRYIRVDGKPLLAVYRPSLFPDVLATVDRWRRWCRENGIGEIHLCMVAAFDRGDPAEYGFDASIEFPPLSSSNEEITALMRGFESGYRGHVYNYAATVKNARSYVRPNWVQYRGIMPSWDNTARKMERGHSFFGATPELYAEWLDNVVQDTIDTKPESHRLVFVNAWNEWGEGACLEPDRRRGYAYLNRTREVVARHASAVIYDAELKNIRARRHEYAVIVHLHYGELLDSIEPFLQNIPAGADLFFSVRDGCYPEMMGRIRRRWSDAVVVAYPNHGRDVLPFLRMMECLAPLSYQAICKIHGKRSRHRVDGDVWRDDVLSKLLGNRERVLHCLSLLKSGAGIVAPAGHLLDGSTYWGRNAARVTELAVRMGCPPEWAQNFRFPAGTMFWFRPEALAPLFSVGLKPAEFEAEFGQVDGTTAHAVERLIGLSVMRAGLSLTETDDPIEGQVYRFAAPTKRQ